MSRFPFHSEVFNSLLICLERILVKFKKKFAGGIVWSMVVTFQVHIIKELYVSNDGLFDQEEKLETKIFLRFHRLVFINLDQVQLANNYGKGVSFN